MKKGTFVFILSLLIAIGGLAQGISIQLGRPQVAKNQAFTITILAQNEKVKSYDKFPEISGFQQGGTSSSSSMNWVNGRTSSTHKITMNYYPTKQGNFKLSPFSITVNGKEVQSKGINITVTPEQQRQQRDPFEEFFGNRRSQPQEFVEVEDDAFFSVSSNKSSVYVGEGFTVTTALYIPEEQQSLFGSPNDFSEQILNIQKKIAPKSCWEEKFEITNVKPDLIELKGRRYLRYTLGQSVFYPFKEQNIKIPSTTLNLVKYKMAKQRSFFGRNAQAGSKKFKSKARTIKVKALPEHPLKNIVPVGNYKLAEHVNKNELNTNESINYTFKIYGEGNINTVNAPQVESSEELSFFPPNTLQEINRSNGRVTGEKAFKYSIIPQEPGAYALQDYLNFIFFNPKTAKYDTLNPSITFNVVGESRKNSAIESSDMGTFYNLIEESSNDLISLNRRRNTQIFSNIVIGVILSALIGLFIYKKKKDENG